MIVALSWWFLASGAGIDGMDSLGVAGMEPPPLGALILMWWLMMVAMMLPSAAPAILLYGRVREMRGADAAIAQTWVFLVGYVGIWLIFSIAAAGLQQLITGPSMALADHRLAGPLFIVVGLYQLSPLKSACLRQCRSPAQFLSRHWRPGMNGAIRLGALRGAYCVGCCWMLMALLFVGGVMNFLWIVALTVIVGIEKLVPKGDVLGRVAGAALVVWGVVRLAG